MNTFDAPTSGAEEYVHDNRIDLKFIAGVLFLEFFAFAFVYGASGPEGSSPDIGGILFGVVLGLIPAMRFIHRAGRRTGFGVRRTAAASTVRYTHGVLRLSMLLVLLVAIALIMFGISTGEAGGLIIFSLFSIPFLVSWAALIRSARGRPRIELTIDGIVQQGLGFKKSIPWNSVASVLLQPTWPPAIGVMVPWGEPFEHTKTCKLRLDEQPGLFSGAFIDCRFFDVHPVVLTQWIRFYLEYPTLRQELGTDAATDRLANLLP